MLSKCANPSCSTPLVYLREGKVFMMEQTPGSQPSGNPDRGKQGSPARVEHFWLCGRCSAELTLVHHQNGVMVSPKAQKKARAAARGF